jgi:L-rhamnose mutarotase
MICVQVNCKRVVNITAAKIFLTTLKSIGNSDMEIKKIAFKMKLIPGFEEEYEKRHREIWPELAQLLKESGILDYSIYLDTESSTLFAIQTVTGISSSQSLGNVAVVQKWWEYMADIMETNPDNSPVSTPLKNVFTLT